MATPDTHQNAALCPRCQRNPRPRRGPELCTNCRAEEALDASGTLPLGQQSAKPEPQQPELPKAPPEAPPPAAETKPAAEPPVQRTRSQGPSEMPAPAPPPSAPPQETGRRMSLGNVLAKPTETRHKVAIYGPEGTGKTTFGQEAPSPIFIPLELSGTLLKRETPRFPQPTTWRELLDAVDELGTAQHPYKTLVIDTLDRVQDLAFADVLRDYNASQQQNKRANSIEEVGGGFQKGYVHAVEKVRMLLARLERLTDRRGMNVILIGHGQVRKVNDPALSDPYDQWDLCLVETNNAPIAGTVRNWVDTLLFVNFQTEIKRDRRGRPTRRAESPADGNRRLYTQRSPRWRAKNRDGLPLELPFSWENYAWAVASSEDPAYLRQVIADKVEELADAAIAQWVDAELKKEPNRARLNQINLKLSARLEQIENDAGAEETQRAGGEA